MAAPAVVDVPVAGVVTVVVEERGVEVVLVLAFDPPHPASAAVQSRTATKADRK